MISNLLKRTVTSLLLIIILCFALFQSILSWKILLIFFLILCYYEFYKLFNKIIKKKFLKIISFILIFLYLYFFYSLLIMLKINYGEELILLLLTACIFSDMGGYFVGKLIGGPKLTNISPNKTISGALGSIIFTIIGTSMFVQLLKITSLETLLFEFSFKNYIWIILMSIFCQVGDLMISYLKRKANVKDTGNILPGHGGILDRVDGIILAIPLSVLAYIILNLKV